jgi:hypothetical protein
MPRSAKLLIGLAAILLMGWIYHGPLGRGAAYIDALEGQARAAVATTGLPAIDVRLGRDPLTRAATLSGTADAFQRDGQGELKGLNDLVGEVEGISAVGWSDRGGAPQGLPLLAELLAWLALAFAVGVGLGWLLFGRPKRESYL